MEFMQVVEKRRSCRAFDPSPLPGEDLQAIIRAGCLAPSPLNLQPWEFIVVTEPNAKEKICQVAKQAKQRILDQDGPSWVKKYDMEFLKSAPLLVAVTVNPKKGGLGEFFDQPLGAFQAGCAAIQNIMLSAADMGYDSLWFTFFEPGPMKEALGVPENLELPGIVLVGRPQEPASAPPRKPPRIHYQQYNRE